MKNEDKKDEESEDEEEVGAKYQNPVAGMLGHSQIGRNPSRRPSTRVGIPEMHVSHRFQEQLSVRFHLKKGRRKITWRNTSSIYVGQYFTSFQRDCPKRDHERSCPMGRVRV